MLGWIRSLVILLFFYGDYCKTTDVHKKLHHDMTPAERNVFFGISSNKEVPEYEITYPFSSNEKGEILSNDLSYQQSRKRRNIGKGNSLYFNVQGFGLNLVLNVSLNQNILGPNFKIRHSDGKTTSTPEHTEHLVGSIVSHPKSTVAISNREGLQGMIKLNDETFFIHPLPSRLGRRHRRSFSSMPHIISKKPDEPSSQLESENYPLGDEETDYVNSRRSENVVEDSSHKYLQTIYVVDQYVVDYFGQSTIENLLPVLANIVAGLFRDESFGEIKLNYVLNEIIFLNNSELSYFVNTTANNKLHEIAQWVKNNYGEIQDSPEQPVDSVTLISRGGSGGRAFIGTMCTRDYPSSSMANIAGINSAAVIAHEVLHNLGGNHDGSKKECPDKKYVMSTSVSSGPAAFAWSTCSRNESQKFLRSGASSCLNDAPLLSTGERPSVDLATTLPGVLYDGDKQCELQYGVSYKLCPNQDQCNSLYCTTDNRLCHTHYSPPLDGTRCGVRHWCIKGVCVDDGSPIIDGGWGDWSEYYGDCSTTCGGGVHYLTRPCDNPSPANGGENCEGNTRGNYRICNAQPCPKEDVSFRQQQCSAKGNYDEYIKPSERCTLICRTGNTIYWLGNVKDGTRCNNDKNILDVCIQGHCKEVGCDHMLGSGKRLDRCRVCGGDGSSCRLNIFNYTKRHRGYGFPNPDSMVILPAQSSNVFAVQKAIGYNMIGVQSVEGEYLIVPPKWSTTVSVADTTISYVHEDNKYRDRIYIPGPTTHEMKLVFIFLYENNRGIDISYYSPGVSNETTTFKWQLSDWSECSRSCAAGLKTRLIQCVRSDDMTEVGYDSCSQSTKPDIMTSCNTQPCPPEWYATPWQICSLICGKGTQQRSVTCRQKLYENEWDTLANGSSCTEPKPEISPLERDCNQVNCPPEYVATEWSECSTTCSTGIMTRKLQCQRRTSLGVNELLPDHWCKENQAVELPTTENCNTDSPCEPPPHTEIACFMLDTSIFPTVLYDFYDSLDYEDVSTTARKCAKMAFNQNYKYFGLANDGECRVGPNLPPNFFKPPLSDDCKSFVGETDAIFVYTLAELPSLSVVGCFKDRSSPRSMPVLIKNFRDQINWYDMGRTIHQCAQVAYNSGYQYFGVQYYGECWSGPNAGDTYYMYGVTDTCWKDAYVGGEWSNFVYTFN